MTQSKDGASLPEPAFRLTWRDGTYRVSKPGIDETDCYTTDQMHAYARAALAAIPQAPGALTDEQAQIFAHAIYNASRGDFEASADEAKAIYLAALSAQQAPAAIDQYSAASQQIAEPECLLCGHADGHPSTCPNFAGYQAPASGEAPQEVPGEPEPTRDAWELESDFEHRLNAWHTSRQPSKAVQEVSDEEMEQIADAIWGAQKKRLPMAAAIQFARAILAVRAAQPVGAAPVMPTMRATLHETPYSRQLAQERAAEEPANREPDLYDEIECDLPYLFGRASLEGHEVGQRLALEVRAKMKLARDALAAPVRAVEQPSDEAIKAAITNAIGYDWVPEETQVVNAGDLLNIAQAILALAAPKAAEPADKREQRT